MQAIESSRTKLRRFKKSDIGHLIELESDEEIMRYTGPGMALSLDKINERFKYLLKEKHGKLGLWAAELKDSGDFVGWFMLRQTRFEHPELGFMLLKRYWRQGLATEVCRTLISYGFNRANLHKIVATTHPQNTASIRVLEKAGLQFKEMISTFNLATQTETLCRYYEIEKRDSNVDSQ